MNHLKLKLSLVSAIITLSRMITLSAAQNCSFPSIPPPNVTATSTTPTTISITWDQIPCQMRNGRIYRYFLSLCNVSASNSQPLTSTSFRNFTFSGLIPRNSYNISIRADTYTDEGSFSSPVMIETSPVQGLSFFLNGVIYPPNVALDLRDIGEDGNSLRCLTFVIPCCRTSHNPNGSRGIWRFPDKSVVHSKNHTNYIYRTRGHSSVLLHRFNNVTCPTGVYTCEIPDNVTLNRELHVHLYANQRPGLNITLDYSCQAQHITCTVHGGLVDDYNWTKDGVLVDGNDQQLEQYMSITDRHLVISQVVLSSSNRSYFQGTFQCTVRDGIGRVLFAAINFNDDFLTITSNSPLIAGAVDDVLVNCSAAVDCHAADSIGDLVYTWYNSEGKAIVSSNRTIISYNNNMSTLTLSPLSIDDSNVTCCVVGSERLDTPNSNDSSCVSMIFIIKVPDPPVINITISGNSSAGEVYSLTCDVSLSQNLRQSSVIEWVGPDGNVIDNTTLRDMSLASSSPSTTLTLIINPLRTSHRGMYWCRATLTDTAANIRIINNSSFTITINNRSSLPSHPALPPKGSTNTSSKTEGWFPSATPTSVFLTSSATSPTVCTSSLTGSDNIQTEDSSRVNTQQTTSMMSMPSSPNITTIIIAVIIIIIAGVITVPVLLIILLLCFKKPCFRKEENNIPIQFKMSERSADDIICDSTSHNVEQSVNDGATVYSVVRKHAKKTNEEEAGKDDDEEKKDEMSVYYSTVCDKKEPNKSEVQDGSDLYATVDKCAKKKNESPEEDRIAVHYSTVCDKKEPNKSEVQDGSDLYATVDKCAKKKNESPEEDKIAVHYSTVCNKEEPNNKSEVQDVSDLYATVDKSAKRKEKSPDEMASLAKVNVMKKTI